VTPLHYVGAAYAAIFALLFLYAWSLTAKARRLGERLDELEREHRGPR
jgi:CcmD family protein